MSSLNVASLVKYLRLHDVKVLAAYDDVIEVESSVLDTQTGETYWEVSRIPSTLESVRSFLGY